MSHPELDLVLKDGAQVVAWCRAPSIPNADQQLRLTDPNGHWRSYEILRTEASNEKPGSTSDWARQLHEGGPSDKPVIWCTWRPKR